MKTKKVLAAILAALMLLSVCVTGVTATDEIPFTDLKKNWSYDSIKYVYEKGLMNGTGDGTTFSPKESLTRAMVVTVLFRMSGSPKVNVGASTYGDLKEGAYYYEAVNWAQYSKIVTSTGINDYGEDMFAPNRAITRQELATMFVRYAEYSYVKTEKLADISSYKDVASVANWAKKAMQWCNEVGLIKGTGSGDTLSPKETATREQFAAIIYRYCTAEFEYEYVLNMAKPVSTFTEKDYPLVEDADLYVAVDGDDKNPGTKNKPLKTFAKAVEKVRELKKSAKDEIVVAFKAGDYGNLQLELGELDAGSAEVPIKYCKYGDGDVLFSNGVTAFIDEFGPIDESDYHLFPEKNRNKIVKADMSDKETIGEMTAMSQLFSEEERIEMARFPNQGGGKDTTMVIVDTFESTEGSIGYGAWNCVLKPHVAARFATYHTYDNIAAIGCAGHEYDGDYLLADGYDLETKTLKLIAQDTVYAFGSMGGVNVYYMNISEELDQSGEYWFDPDTKMLYLYDPTYKRYTLSTTGTFLKLDGADYISFVGLDFSYCSGDSIIVNANNVHIDDAEILGSNGDYTAVLMDGYNNSITNSELSHLAAGGIVITGGDFEFLTSSNILVDNNCIHDYGQIYHTWTAGVRLHDVVGAVVSHNEIYHAPHIALMFANIWDRSIDCIMEYNYIHDLLTYGDLGAVYCGRLHTDRDNIVRYNLFTNINEGGGGAWSVYIDDGMTGQQFYGNVFYQPGGYAFLHSGGRDNVVRDNVIIGNQNGSGNPLRVWAKWANMVDESGYVTSGNWTHLLQLIPGHLPKDPEAMKLWQERWPEFFAVYDVEKLQPKIECIPENLDKYDMMANSAGCVIKNNYSFGYAPTDGTNVLEHWVLDVNENKFNDFTNNPIWGREAIRGEGDAPHIFKNPALGDYTLVENHGLEFETPYDYTKIGRY